MLDRFEGSNFLKEEDLNQYPYRLNVKKGYTFGNICLFEGEIIIRKDQK